MVDTLIDLQMEDAPLILKKSVLGDKCGSCNQYIQDKTNNISQLNISQYNVSQYMSSPNATSINHPNATSINQGFNSIYANNTRRMDNSQEIKQLRNIQDNSNKFNSGSYSRILLHADNENVKEDLKPTPILRQSGSSKVIPKIQPVSSKNFNRFNEANIQKDDASPYKGELEKTSVNGNNLVRKVNKEYYKIAKQNKEANKDIKLNK